MKKLCVLILVLSVGMSSCKEDKRDCSYYSVLTSKLLRMSPGFGTDLLAYGQRHESDSIYKTTNNMIERSDSLITSLGLFWDNASNTDEMVNKEYEKAFITLSEIFDDKRVMIYYENTIKPGTFINKSDNECDAKRKKMLMLVEITRYREDSIVEIFELMRSYNKG